MLELVRTSTLVVEGTGEHGVVAVLVEEVDHLSALARGHAGNSSKSEDIGTETRGCSEGLIKAHVVCTLGLDGVFKFLRGRAEGEISKAGFDDLFGTRLKVGESTVVVGSAVDGFALREDGEIFHLFILASGSCRDTSDGHPVVRTRGDQTRISSSNWDILHEVSP